ncbi:MAG: hypothetical protein EOO92_03535 [Pedobacter sp.]|nr:MAG: hypothetical protein EOO92_03535 [Pedobacter sp.]
MNTSISKLSKLAVISFFGITFLSACKKDRTDKTIDPIPSATVGVYVLTEGFFGAANNSSITYYDIASKTSTKNYFKQQNGIELGSNANDLKQYGSKMYCVVNGTTPAAKDSYVEVIDIATGKSLKRIPFYDATKGFMPRFIQFHKNKAYVSSYDGNISRIDTTALTIESRLKVGEALEELAIVNNKLYVTNSSHPVYTVSNNASVSVVDLNTFTKLTDIPTRVNPTRISATNNGDVFVLCKGDYAAIIPGIARISSVTDKQTAINDANVEILKFTGAKGFVFGPYGDEYLKLLNATTGLPGDLFVTDATKILTPYGVTADTFTNNIFVADANAYGAEGKVIAFSATGKIQFEFATGPLPQSAVFKYSYK